MDADDRMRPELLIGDITRLEVDAIVNAANESLLGGGGVDGAIHAAAGPGLLAECRTVGGCPAGEVRVTAGHDLPAPHVIHTVGPRWRGGEDGEDAILAACYRNSLEAASERGFRSVAFPAISTGAFGFPARRAARIAHRTVSEFLRGDPGSVERVALVLFDEASLAEVRAALEDPTAP